MPRQKALDDLVEFRCEYAPDTCANAEDRYWRVSNLGGFDIDTPLVNIKYIGVWDTVKTLGDPMMGDRDGDGEYDAAEFHDHHLYAEVEAARHAIALDERRKKFDVTPWDNIDELNAVRGFRADDPDRPYQQLWFPGDHGSVGGGGDVRGLSDEGLEWVLKGAKDQGLALEVSAYSKIWNIRPDALAPLVNTATKDWSPSAVIMRNLSKADRMGPQGMHEVSQAAIIRWASPEQPLYRPGPLDALVEEMNQAAAAYAPWEFASRGGYAGETLAKPFDSEGRSLRRYEIRTGDSLGEIAGALLGDKERAAEILALNRMTILDAGRFYVGQIINLPPS